MWWMVAWCGSGVKPKLPKTEKEEGRRQAEGGAGRGMAGGESVSQGSTEGPERWRAMGGSGRPAGVRRKRFTEQHSGGHPGAGGSSGRRTAPAVEARGSAASE